MIIKGNARGNAKWLAGHLGRTDTNAVAQVLEVRGTVATDMEGAFREIVAVAAGTRCRDALYHANIDPRADEPLSPEQWAAAIDRLEDKLGFEGQPHVVVRHIKDGREHVHVVWSRIDAERMLAIPDSFNYPKHEEVARALEREFGHERVQGAHAEREGKPRPDRAPNQDEMEQGKRTGINPRDVRSEITTLWNSADNGKAFAAALDEAGYCLARGDRRDFVLVDEAGGVHSLARRIEGGRAKDVRERLADLDPATLPDLATARIRQEDRARAVEEAAKERSGKGGAQERQPGVPAPDPVVNPAPTDAEKSAEEEKKKQKPKRLPTIDELRDHDPRIRREEDALLRQQALEHAGAKRRLHDQQGRDWKEREDTLKAWSAQDARDDARLADQRRAEDEARRPQGVIGGVVSKALDWFNPGRVRERAAQERDLRARRREEDDQTADQRERRNETRSADVLRALHEKERKDQDVALRRRQDRERAELQKRQMERFRREAGLEQDKGLDRGDQGRDRGDRGRGR
jgi:hypothetical protein